MDDYHRGYLDAIDYVARRTTRQANAARHIDEYARFFILIDITHDLHQLWAECWADIQNLGLKARVSPN